MYHKYATDLKKWSLYSITFVGTDSNKSNYNNMKTQILAVRITELQKEQIRKQAKEMRLSSSELVRTHIVNLIEHGTLNKQKSR